MILERDTVAVPFSSGVQPNIPGRLLDPQKLLVAQNCFYPGDAAPEKRNGHDEFPVHTSAAYPGLGGLAEPTGFVDREPFSNDNPGFAAQNWLFGWGIRGAQGTEFATTLNPYEPSPQPNTGLLFGASSRDNELLAWDSHRLFSYASSSPNGRFGETQSGTAGTAARGPSIMPVLRVAPIAKISTSQLTPVAAASDTLKVTAWADLTGLTVSYSVYDAQTDAAIVVGASLTFQSIKSLRLIVCDSWFHILVSDTTANVLEMRSFHKDTPSTVISRSLGTVDNQFDVKKVDETKFVVAKLKGTVITLFVNNSDGSTQFSFTPDLGGHAAVANSAIAIELDYAGNIGLAWQSGGPPSTVFLRTYNQGGSTVSSAVSVGTVQTNSRMTVAPRAVSKTAGFSVWDLYVEDTVSTVKQTRVFAVDTGAGTVQLNATRWRVGLNSHAFRAGQRTFVWTHPVLSAGVNALQNTYFLMDSALLVVGKMDYGLANPDTGSTVNTLPDVNWYAPTAAYGDRLVFSGARGYKQRLTVASSQTSAIPTNVFSEPSIHFYKLDFSPPLRSAQAGRSTYFAGAQLWAYDGSEVVEAGFHMAPEDYTLTDAGAGNLSAGDYRYRIDLCHKNAQNEEVRSWSLVSPKITLAASHKVTLSISNMPFTRREDSYFLIFRTEANGTIYYLVNSRDPASANFIKNDLTQNAFTFSDNTTDASLILNEWHPANSGVGGTYVDPLPCPACEVVAAGRDRLWVAGGELSPGEVAPSRLFFPGQTPAFSPALNIQVDRNAEQITGIGFTGEIAVIFRKTSAYIVEGSGPDNNFNGSWPDARRALADTGAISQESLVSTTHGLWFLSPAGIRMMNTAGGLDPKLGHDVNPLAIDARFAGAVVVPKYTEIRWYSKDAGRPTLVYNYSNDSWTTWTISCMGAVFSPARNLAVLARPNGVLWVEDVAAVLDGSSPFEMVVRTSWLHAGAAVDFQRVRRIALVGEASGTFDLRVRYFYDERVFHDEEQIVSFPFNPSTWGSATWGGGTWGDASNTSTTSLDFRDGVFRFRKRPARQKCSVFSVEFSDQGSSTGKFSPVALGLELAKKPGLDRVPTGL